MFVCRYEMILFLCVDCIMVMVGNFGRIVCVCGMIFCVG